MKHRRAGLQRPLCGLLVFVVAFSAGCAIPTESEPRRLSADQLPEGFVPTSAAPNSEEAGSDTVSIWFQTPSGGLRRVDHNVDEASVESAINALLEPIPSDSPGRLTNQWNAPEVGLTGLDLNDDRLVVSLSTLPPAAEGALAGPTFAQLVWTATQDPFGVEEVLLEVEGEPIRMVAGKDGAEFVSRDDFANQPVGVPETGNGRKGTDRD